MDPVSAARSARESLARGLAALQSPGLPPQLLSAADPVAQAMSALHRIESSGGAAAVEAAPAALANVRQALATLQSQPIAHPAVEQALEAIAGSLGMVHQLAQAFSRPAQAAPQAGYAQPQAGYAPQPAGYGHAPVAPQASAAFSDGSGGPPQSAIPLTQPSHSLPYEARPEPKPQVAVVTPGSHRGSAADVQPQAWGQPASAGYGQPGSGHGAAPKDHASTLSSAGQPGSSSNLQRIEAALGAHSSTNFYKGLSGNDVIESGGIFVATYQIPPIGSNLVIHVSLPGGYEFDASAVVRWTREAPNSGSDSPPGFGAQFTQISPEGRQLVYRYVRNREPLFHDDF